MSDSNLEQETHEELTKAEEEPAASAGVEEMQAELVDLRRQVAESQAKEKEGRHLGRRWVVGLLIVLGCIALAGANATVWLRNVVLDTDVWASTVSPLSQNEVIVNTLSTYVVGELFQALEVEQVAQEALPERARLLTGPLMGVLEDLARDTVATVIRSDQFNAVWEAANRTAHALVMGVLRNDIVQQGQLAIDLGDLIGFVEDTFGVQDLALFGAAEDGKIVILENQQIAQLQAVLDIVDAAGWVFPLLALGAFLGAWLVSLWRRSTVLWIGVGTAIAMGLSLIVIAVVQPALVATIVDPLVRSVAGEVVDVLLRGLVIQTILLAIIGILVAVGAALAGPSPRAVAFRASFSERLGGSAE